MRRHKELKMEFTTKNSVLRLLSHQLCSWGQRMPTYDQMNNIIGNTAPLWINPSKTFYLSFAIINCITAIMFISSFAAVSYVNNNSYPSENLNSTTDISSGDNLSFNYTSITNVKNRLHPNDYLCIKTVNSSFGSFFIVIGAVIIIMNSISNLYLYIVDYASDEEWYRYLFGQFILSICLFSLDIGEYYFVAKNFKLFTEDENDLFTNIGVVECPKIFNFNVYMNLFVALINSFLCLIQGGKTIANYKELFYNEDQDRMRASSEDNDIIIMCRRGN